MAWISLVILVGAPAEAGAPLVLPAFEGGSTVYVGPTGRVEVRDLDGRALRWSVGLGASPRQVVADDRALYVTTGHHLRAFSRGVSRWALDLGQPAEALELVTPGRLLVVLPAGRLFVDASRGRFCTPRDPCSGLPAWQVGQIGIPFLDLPGFGVPGLGLGVNPILLEAGDVLGGVVSPGVPYPWVPAPPAPLPSAGPQAASLPPIVVGYGPSGKVRSLSASGIALPAPTVVVAPDQAQKAPQGEDERP